MRAKAEICFRISMEVGWLWRRHSDSDFVVMPARAISLGRLRVEDQRKPRGIVYCAAVEL